MSVSILCFVFCMYIPEYIFFLLLSFFSFSLSVPLSLHSLFSHQILSKTIQSFESWMYFLHRTPIPDDPFWLDYYVD